MGAPRDSVRLPAESGGGYLGYVQMLHYIHCLYKLNQYVNDEYYGNRTYFWTIDSATRKDHAGMIPCLHLLLL